MERVNIKKIKETLKEMPEDEFVVVLDTYKESDTKTRETAEFIFWVVNDTEARLKELALRAMSQGRKGGDLETVRQFVEDSFDEMMFIGKINLVEKNLDREGSKKDFTTLLSTLKELNSVRNSMFHQKTDIKDIKYKGKLIGDKKTKETILLDLIKGFQKM
jgi:hypothetical protein